MAFTPFQDAGLSYSVLGDPEVAISDSVFSVTAQAGVECEFGIRFNTGSNLTVRATVLSWQVDSSTDSSRFEWNPEFTPETQFNDAPNTSNTWEPTPITMSLLGDGTNNPEFSFLIGSSEGTYTYQILIEADVDTPPPTSGSFTRTSPQLAYELDKGWSFDGAYIPHFVILNWYFGDNPVIYKGFQKVRIHGLTKGRAFLQLSVNGIEDEYSDDGFTTPQYIDIPKAATYVVSDFKPSTNYTDTANRGLGVQFKFEGRNTNIALPEPSHVIQVLVLQGTPDSTGKRAN